MDRHLPDDQLDRVLLGFFTERRDELLATAPTAHLVAVRVAASVSPTTARRRRPVLALLVALLLTLLAAAAIVVGSGLLKPSPIPAERGVFTPTGSLDEEQLWLWPTATLLADGRVLVVGGGSVRHGTPARAPRRGTRTTGRFTLGRHRCQRAAMHHTATLLPDGRVLVVGGSDQGHPTRSAEIWDPRTSLVPPDGIARPAAVRTHRPPAARWPGPRGRRRTYQWIDEDAEDLGSATGAFSPAGWPLPTGLIATAVVLRDGRVLVIGRDSARIWDPATGTTVATGSPIGGHVAMRVLPAPGRSRDGPEHHRRSPDRRRLGSGVAVLLARGIVARRDGGGPCGLRRRSGRSAARRWPCARLRGWGRRNHTTAGRGSWCQGPTDIAEIWDPATGSFSRTGSMGDAPVRPHPDGHQGRARPGRRRPGRHRRALRVAAMSGRPPRRVDVTIGIDRDQVAGPRLSGCRRCRASSQLLTVRGSAHSTRLRHRPPRPSQEVPLDPVLRRPMSRTLLAVSTLGSVLVLGLAGAAPAASPRPASPSIPHGGESVLAYGSFGKHDGHGEVYTIRADGTDRRHVGRGFSPVWSPDGSMIAYNDFPYETPGNGGWNLMIADATGTRVLVEGIGCYGIEFPVSWSPDSRFVLYPDSRTDGCVDGSGWDLMVVPADGSAAPSRLLAMPLSSQEFSWSPRGDRIAIQTSDEGRRGIWVADVPDSVRPVRPDGTPAQQAGRPRPGLLGPARVVPRRRLDRHLASRSRRGGLGHRPAGGGWFVGDRPLAGSRGFLQSQLVAGWPTTRHPAPARPGLRRVRPLRPLSHRPRRIEPHAGRGPTAQRLAPAIVVLT